MKKWLTYALGPLISLAIIYVLVGRDLDAVRGELARAHYGYLIPTGVLLIFSLLARAIRWHVLLNRRVTVWHAFHITNIGYMASAILPLRVGDLARPWMTTRLNPPVAGFTAISTIVVERLLDILALVAMLGVMLVLLDVPTEVTSAGAVVAVLAFSGGLVLAGMAAKPNWVLNIIDWLTQRLHVLNHLHLKERFRYFVRGIQPMGKLEIAFGALLWTTIAWGFSLAAGYVMLLMLFETPTLAATLSYIVLSTMSVALPAVPGNLGPFEGAVVGGLWIGGLITAASPPHNAPAVATGVVLHALTLGLYVTLGLVGLSAEQASIRQIAKGTQELVLQEV
ncbi:MAG: flippase-like domain-containing protein [Anaerolineales bacterium]|nr:flippase-like domain-containing protein [Anaerolineales bacterium]